MMKTWVITKVRKIGTRGRIDSFTPRMFMTVRTATPKSANRSLYGSQADGRKLNSASAPLATEIVIMLEPSLKGPFRMPPTLILGALDNNFTIPRPGVRLQEFIADKQTIGI